MTTKGTPVLGSVRQVHADRQLLAGVAIGRRRRSLPAAGRGEEAEARHEAGGGAAELVGIGAEEREEDRIGNAGAVGIADAGAREDRLAGAFGDVLDRVLRRIGHERARRRRAARGRIRRRPRSVARRRRAREQQHGEGLQKAPHAPSIREGPVAL